MQDMVIQMSGSSRVFRYLTSTCPDSSPVMLIGPVVWARPGAPLVEAGSCRDGTVQGLQR
jgi:hypothetical protein